METPLIDVGTIYANESTLPSSLMPEFTWAPQASTFEFEAFDPGNMTFDLPHFASDAEHFATDFSGPSSAQGPIVQNSMDQYANINVSLTQPAQVAPQAAAPPGRFLCTYLGCGKDFSRAKDRDRHAGKHSLARPFPCTFPGCHASGAGAFYRQDKLREHLRKRHMLNI